MEEIKIKIRIEKPKLQLNEQVFSIFKGDKGDTGDTGIVAVEVTGSGNALTSASYDENARKLTFGSSNFLPGSTKYGNSLSVSGTSLSLKDQDGTVLSTITTQDDNDNQKVKTSLVTFGANDTVEFVAGTNISITGDSVNKTITIASTDTDTNTWRPVKVNGTEKLTNSTSGNSLDLVAGTNISLSESSGAVTITATDTDTGATSVEMHSGDTGNALTNLTYDSVTRKLTFEKSTTFASINQISNPNLLINGDFKVNQRGLATYNTVNKYTVDRWELTGGASEVVVNSNGTITLNVLNPDTTARILQYIEDTQYLLGKTVTFTIKTSNETYSTTATLPATLPNVNTDYGDKNTGNIGRLRISYISSLQMFCFKIEAFAGGAFDNTVTLEYAKVEIGSVATPFSPRPYAEELALCQRYYQTALYEFTFFAQTTSAGYGHINLPVTMRTTPTATFPAGYIHGGDGYLGSPTSINISGTIKDNCVRFAVGQTFVQNRIYMLESSNIITFDAEIY